MFARKNRNKRLRFTFDDDLVLLREVVAHNPISNPEKWEVIQQNLERMVSKKFVKRTLKQHLQLLLKVWMNKQAICKIRSDNEEPYSEKDSLLQEISVLCHESGLKNKHKERNVSKEETTENIVVSFVNEDCGEEEDNIKTDNLVIFEHDYEGNRMGSNKNTTLKKGTLSYLDEEQDMEHKLRTKELELEERRISIREREVALEERKVALEERQLQLLEVKHEVDTLEARQKIELEKDRFKLELAERKTTSALLESQQKIIDNLLNNFRS